MELLSQCMCTNLAPTPNSYLNKCLITAQKCFRAVSSRAHW